ncbi:MAG: ferrous iron transport protein A [Alphaproteobacteria bacterium]|jgi:ferrous iron transport protein A
MTQPENQIVRDFSTLRAGDRAVIAGFSGAAPAYRKKLLAMGMTPGTPFQVVRIAPLGDPVEILVRGYLVSLRRHEAAIISVTAVNG